MAKTYHTSNQWALAGLFKRITLGDDPKLLQNEACHLAEKVDSDDITAAQKALVDEGYSYQLVQKITAAFVLMGLPKKKSVEAHNQLAANHILQKIKAENAMALCYLQDLEEISGEIVHLEKITNVSSEFRQLTRIAAFFVQFKLHIEREEHIIFPYLQKYGWKGLCKSDEDEHKMILLDIDNLTALVGSLDALAFEQFSGYLQKVVDHLVSTLTAHLIYECDILWPIAQIVIEGAHVWETIKALCDEFEY